ncbi:MAG: 50S ribosomal protein L32, partial [Clostridiales bacterium]|nr:50S ribosomal protein L32 [Clostridiales bacterium]
MAVPKSKVSKQRRDKRRANWKLAAPAVTTCPKCGAYRLPHRLCKACMTYDGKVFGQ